MFVGCCVGVVWVFGGIGGFWVGGLYSGLVLIFFVGLSAMFTSERFAGCFGV